MSNVNETFREEQIGDEGSALFQTLFEQSSDAYLIIDEGIFVDCNQATIEMLRAKNKEEVLSTHPSQLSPEFQPDRQSSGPKADEMIQIALEEGSHRFEWVHRKLDGEDFPVEVLLTPIPLGERTIIHTVWRDIANRKRLIEQTAISLERRDEQLKISTEVAQQIAAATDLDQLFERVVTLTKDQFNYYHTQLLRYDPTQDAVVLVTGYGQIGEKMLELSHQMPMGSGLIGTAAATGKTVMRPDLADEPEWESNPLLPETKGEIAVPIKWQETVLGVLDVQVDQANAISDEDRLLLEGLCDQIAIAMHSAQLVEEVRTSQERYELAVAGSNDGLWDWDITTNVVYYSPRLKEMVGYTDEEFGNDFAEFEEKLHPEDHDRVMQSVTDYLEGKIPTYEPEFRFRHKDGSYRWILARGTAIRNADGAPIRMAGSHTDTTERRQVQEGIEALVEERTTQLQESETRFRSFFDNSADAYLIIDEGLFVDCNQATVEMLGAKNKEDVLNTHPSQLSPEFQLDERSSGEKADEMIQIALDKGSHRFEWTHRRIDGEDFPAEVLLTPIQLGDKKVIYTVWRDISNRKRLEQETQEALERRGYQVQISTEISQEIAQASELSDLFDRVVTLTKERLGYYHTQLLRYDPNQDAVVLISGYGETGAKMLEGRHSMPMGSGLIGTAAAVGESVLRSNLADDLSWQPNPLLPDTRGEIAVPIKLGDEILGVLDIQSDQVNALTEDDQLLLEGLCGQIAIAMDQTRLRQEMEERLTEINRLYRAMSREGWQSYSEAATLPEGFHYDQVGVHAIENFSETQSMMAASLTVPGGDSIGTLAIADDPNSPLTPEDQAFLEQVSEQVALALESARLTEQTQIALARTDELYGVSQAINEASTEAEILEALARPAADAGASSAILMYLDLDKAGKPEWTEIVADWRTEGQAPIPIGTRFYLPEMPLSTLWMADPDNPLLISDVRTDERVDDIARGLMEQGGSRALVIVPLTRGREQIATLIFNWDQSHEFRTQEEETYRAIIGLASPAVQSRRLFEQMQDALDEVQRSEETLREVSGLQTAILEGAEYAIISTTLEGLLTTFNTGAENMLGYKADELVNKESPAAFHDLDEIIERAKTFSEEVGYEIEPGFDVFTAKARQNLPNEHEWTYIRKDGTRFSVLLNVTALRDVDGEITGFLGVAGDITDRKQAEEAVREAQERFELSVSGSNDGIWDWDIVSNDVYYSPRLKEMVGYEDHEFGNDFAVFQAHLHPDDHDRVMQFVGDYLEGKIPTYDIEFRFRHKDGSYRWILARGTMIRDDKGAPIRMAGSHTDVTERRLQEEATAKRAAELATVAEIGTTISTVLEEQQLLETVVQLTRERFELYHCHIFLADENNQILKIEACGWEAESPHAGTHEDASIHTDQEQSLVAQAARDQIAVIVNDVRAEPNWLPNELLPNTNSEMAVPMIAGNQVLGVLDVQADEVERFSDEDISIMTTLASQVAVALQNARTYAQTQQQAEHEAMINLISQRIQNTTSVENALQVAIRELGRALGAKRTNVQLGLPSEKKPGE